MTSSDRFSLHNRVALVFGANRGIGAASAMRLAAEGATVICAARIEPVDPCLPGSLQQTLEAIAAMGGNGHAVACDPCHPASRARLIAKVIKLFGHIDILINNAFEASSDIPDTELLWQLEINVFAPFDLCQRVLPGMRARGWGRIVNIASPPRRHRMDKSAVMDQQLQSSEMCRFTQFAQTQLTTWLAGTVDSPSSIAINGVLPATFAPMNSTELSPNSDASWPQHSIDAMADAVLAHCLA